MGINDKVILFVGSGNMAEAIVAGMLKKGIVSPKNIICNDIVQDKLDLLNEKYGVSVSLDKKEAVSKADIIFLAVKPQNMQQTLEEIKPYINKKVLVISIAAGITTKFIEDVLGDNIAVARAMPNIPASVGFGTTALCGGRYVLEEDLNNARTIFYAVSITLHVLEEDKFDAVTALSGSGPAYVFYLCELMQQSGEALGLDKEVARDFALATVQGAGMMLGGGDVDAALLRRNVTSPNGTTQAAIEYFKSQNLSDTVQKAMEKAMQRSKELSK